MAGLKAKVTKLEEVEESLRDRYKQGEGGAFFLEIEGIDDHESLGNLRRGKEREHDDRVKYQDAATKLQAQLDELRDQTEKRLRGMLPAENVTALDKSWGEKFERKEKDHTEERTRLVSNLHRLLVDNRAQELAAGLAAKPEQIPLILPHIKARLAVEMNGDEAVTRVLDKSGKPSASTLDDLRKEILADPAFAPVVSGGRASGTGAKGPTAGGAGGGGRGGGAPDRSDKNKKRLADMKPEELAEEMRARKEASGEQ